MRSIIKFFLNQSMFSNLATVIVLLVGTISLFTIRKDLFPQVSFDTTIVTTIYPGASPEQVEKLITNPIEQALREVDGIKKVQSNSIDGRSAVIVILDPNSRNIDKTNQDIQSAINRVQDLPDDAQDPVVTVLESGQSPVIELAFYSDNFSEVELRELSRKYADDISLLTGVAKVTKNAWRRIEWVVSVDQKKLTAAHLSLTDVVQSLKTQNIQLPAGDLVVKNGTEIAVKTDGEVKNKTDIENVYIRSNFEGYGIRIKDIATVELKLEKPSVLYRSNGKQSFSMIISKKSKADALKVVDEIRKYMTTVEARLPAGVSYILYNDFTVYLSNRLSILGGNMIIGLILVLGILAFFFPLRVAFVVALGIPFSMLGAILLLEKIGFSINLVSLIGLIIVSGMLVDDAIVVVENIFRRYEDGEDLDTAIFEGTVEVIPAVTASVLTTVAAFSPMLFMSGIFGKFIFEIPIMVIVPLLISLFEAFIIAPAHFKDLVGGKAHDVLSKIKQDETKVHWYTRFLPHYERLIAWTVDNKYKTLGFFGALIMVTGLAATKMNFILFPPDGIYTFFLRLDGKPGATIHDMKKIVEKIEPYIAKLDKAELQDFIVSIGLQQNDPNDPLTKRAPHYVQFRINLTPEGTRKRKVDEVVEDLRAHIPEKIDGIEKIKFEIAKGGPPQGRPISINVLGDDFEVLRKISAEIKEMLATIEGVIDIEDSEVVGKKEIKVIPNRQSLSNVGLSTTDVAQTIRAAFAGLEASSIRTIDEEINVRVKLKEEVVDQERQLNNIFISNRSGGLVPLDRLATYEESSSRLIVQHEKFQRLLNVSAQVDLTKITAIKATEKFARSLEGINKKYPNYKLILGGESEDTEESMKSLFRSFGYAFLLIFTILILTFGNLIQPLLVVFAIPLGFVGTVWALILHGKPLSFMAMLGIIALAGVIVNNAIVYIAFFNSLKSKMPLRQALISAATTRLRPIILTSLTTVLGLMPTAYGIGGSDGFVKSLALALGWGLALGSLLTVVVFPALLAIVESWQETLARKFKKVLFTKK
ncbi:MAG: efflux RND transporter permease subunit [Bdellovibrionota bacterium]